MPIYAYRCSNCGLQKDVLQKLSEAALTECPSCGASSFSKQLSAPAFQLKGSGWYVTDFRENGKKPDKKGEGEAAAGGEGERSSDQPPKTGDGAPPDSVASDHGARADRSSGDGAGGDGARGDGARGDGARGDGARGDGARGDGAKGAAAGSNGAKPDGSTSGRDRRDGPGPSVTSPTSPSSSSASSPSPSPSPSSASPTSSPPSRSGSGAG